MVRRPRLGPRRMSHAWSGFEGEAYRQSLLTGRRFTDYDKAMRVKQVSKRTSLCNAIARSKQKLFLAQKGATGCTRMRRYPFCTAAASPVQRVCPAGYALQAACVVSTTADARRKTFAISNHLTR